MPRPIDPFRHISILLFIPIAVISGVIALPIMARIGGWKLELQSPIKMWPLAGVACAGLLIELMLWLEFLEFIQNWRKRRAKRKYNSKDQT